MVPSNSQELLEELDATMEQYVRKKLALGGYADWQRPIVEHWLKERADARESSSVRVRALWTQAHVILVGLGILLSAIWHLLK